MSKYYGLAFSSSDPSQYPSLAPTFLTFRNALTGATLSPPSLAQIDVTGIYGFTFSAAFPVYFRVDGITISAQADRYVFGIIDPVMDVDSQLTAASATLQALGNTSVALGTTNVAIGLSNYAFGQTNVALGTSNVALGTSNFALNTSIYAQGLSHFSGDSSLIALIGNPSSTFGTDSVDPATVFGYLKRVQEYNEGSQTFNKVSGSWAISSRGGSLIATKTIGNTSSEVTRS